jgi:hypothetical protein
MDDRYAEAIVDELERIGDLLQTLVNLQAAKLESEGVTNLPRPIQRHANERRSAKARTEGGREPL